MKYRIIILVLVLVASILCSCGPKHTHEFSSDFTSDATHHYHKCECGEKSGTEEHIWDKGVITLYPTTEYEGIRTYTCTVCNYEKNESIEKLESDHEHSYNNAYSDEHSHGFECVCGARGESTEHTWDNGVITTPASDLEMGIKTFTCSECGRKATQNIPSATKNGLSFMKSAHHKISKNLAKTPLTLEAEIFVDPSENGRVGAIFGNYIGVRQDWLLEIHENGVPRFYFTDAAGNIKDYRFTNVDVRTGDWVHIALVFDYSNQIISFYMNGEVVEIISCEMNLAEDTTRYPFVLGGDNRSDNSNYFKGQIRSLAAYSDVRTAGEIAHSAQYGTNLYADDLIVSFHLNEKSAEKDIKDLTGNGYDIPKEWIDSNEVELDYSYSFAIIGDTQWMSKYTPEKMETIYDWLLENKDEKKIAHVMGLGDITEDWNTANKEQEWIRAHQYISKLNGKIPYSLVRGNHDESKYFLKYFANDSYMSQFGGQYMVEGDIRNAYKTFRAGTTDYLLLVLDFGPSDEMLAWANEVVLAHPNHRVIVTTHGYQGFDGGHLNYDNTPSSGGMGSANDVDYGNRSYNNGQQVWEKFVSKHPNIIMVLSGHTPFEDITLLQSVGVHGNVVNQMVIDPQWMDPQKGGVGMVCMFYFSEDGSQMEVEWLSTDTGKYYKEQNQFQLDLSGSINAPAHKFSNSYNDKLHYKACECGYTYNEEPHSFDGGVLDASGFMVYTCECGYQRIASATNDPIALELQALLEKYYNNGVYYIESIVDGAMNDVFYKGDKFYSASGTEMGETASVLSLSDIILGKYGDLRLDIGWNSYDGVYSSANESTLKGFASFVASADLASKLTRVTVEELNYHIVINLFAGDEVVATAKVGMYANTTFIVNYAEVPIVTYTKSNDKGLCEIKAPERSGYVAEYDLVIIDTKHDENLERTVYYSTIEKWDGTTVSEGLSGSGTQDDPFLVTSGADLAYIASVVNGAAATTPNFSGKYFKMTQSIDLDGHNLAIGDYPGWATRKGFHGFFDGNHCTIRGLNNKSSLFGTIESGWLKNLSVYGKVKGSSTIGGIVGYVANGGVLENLVNYVSVVGENTLGGIVGNAENQGSKVVNCVNYGSITGNSWIIGGVVGSAGDIISNCVNYGSVTSYSDVVGGIAGSTKTSGSIEGCYNYGTVKAMGKTGGIVGQVNKPVTDCVNYGEVNGTWAVGGIVGYIKAGDSSKITDCVNHANVTGQTTAIGGVLGLSDKGDGVVVIERCINNGDASTPSWGCGGIAGDTHGDIIDCINNGSAFAAGEVGGIVGKAYGKITGCTNNGTISGSKDIVGGIVGHLHDATYGKVIFTTNTNNGIITGANAQDMVGKGYVYSGDEEANMIGINHRGWYKAPENTLSAYRESYNNGFKYVECDVQFTADGVPVLLHDDTIDRTSNGTGYLSQMTYAEVSKYDFSYDDKDTVNDFSSYRGEKIPTFAEFIALCKELGLHAYIEIKGSITEAEATKLFEIVAAAEMQDNVSWLAFSGEALAKIAVIDPTARLVWVLTDTNATKIAANNIPFATEKLMTGQNEVVFNLYYTLANQSVVDLLKGYNIPLEVWTVNDVNAILGLPSYVTGVTSDMYNAEQVLENAQ